MAARTENPVLQLRAVETSMFTVLVLGMFSSELHLAFFVSSKPRWCLEWVRRFKVDICRGKVCVEIRRPAELWWSKQSLALAVTDLYLSLPHHKSGDYCCYNQQLRLGRTPVGMRSIQA